MSVEVKALPTKQLRYSKMDTHTLPTVARFQRSRIQSTRALAVKLSLLPYALHFLLTLVIAVNHCRSSRAHSPSLITIADRIRRESSE